MKLVADESVDFPIIAALRAARHVVLAVVELAPGIDDETVLNLANQHHALLVTADKDFGELVYRLTLLFSMSPGDAGHARFSSDCF